VHIELEEAMSEIVVVTVNEWSETSSYGLSVAEYMADALDDENGPAAWSRLQELVAGGKAKQIDSDMIREWRAGPGLEAAMQAWIADEANQQALDEQREW
jgi:hypothetical protein